MVKFSEKNQCFIVGVIALRHLPTLLNVDVDVDVRKFSSQHPYIRQPQSLVFIAWPNLTGHGKIVN